MDDNLSIITLLIFLVILIISKNNIEENNNKVMEILKDNEIIETHVNVNRVGNNKYFIIIKNNSGDLVEYNVDLNTYIKHGGKLKGE